ncbi:MAG: hypothetical protein KF696_10630 [Planctomycetes bacterium]|nr:hypothetical protein [Planctomycetota bacterium]MCW8135115.1 hypothetical protein [Planctomycetota bacterium]
MRSILTDAGLARIPVPALALAGRFRGSGRVRAHLDGSMAWLRFDAPAPDIVAALLPAPGAVFYGQAGKHWRRCGSLLEAQVPVDGFVPLESILFPAAAPTPGPAPELPEPGPLQLAPSDRPEAARAMLCKAADVAAWAALAPEPRFGGLRAARAGGAVLILGDALPPIDGRRYWGGRVLLPLGLRASPDLPESALAEVLAVPEHCIALLDESLELIPLSVFAPLSRASARLGAA